MEKRIKYFDLESNSTFLKKTIVWSFITNKVALHNFVRPWKDFKK